ncbi:cation:proton antiporter [Histidinibacterium aquaticum]|uniref:Cation:proton antiporter n=1 Tax=Histidinibacterium aquaticum TaxID=2613962 RepID=A0A5J5GCN2_9RHOB|nr:monovalent cation/H(+) antiporter subunit G [Histidinibacterium aquaticum]KAA9005757.1 cation:proton antiporter [Histidinibacterium aquaticum]
MTNLLMVPGLVLIAAGLWFLLIAALGLWQFPDLMSRLHALTKADTAGVALVALGATCLTASLSDAVVLLLCVLLVAVSGATTGHLIARARLKDTET